jgi:hypothetical protein
LYYFEHISVILNVLHNGSSSTEEEYSVSTSNTYGKARNGQTVDISSRKQSQKIDRLFRVKLYVEKKAG